MARFRLFVSVSSMAASLACAGCLARGPKPQAQPDKPRVEAKESARTPSRARPVAQPALVRLRERLAKAIAAQELSGASHGVMVASLKTGETLFERGPDLLLRPASCLKLLTTAAALETFGPGHVFETPVFAVGELDRSTGALAGPLVVEGRGDPSISGRYRSDGQTTEQIFDRWAESVWRAGVRSVEGVIADGSLFPGPEINPTWEVGDLPYAYAATPTAFAANENCFDIAIAPGERAGASAKVSISPDNSLVAAEGFVVTWPAEKGRDATIDRPPGINLALLGGGIALDEQPWETWRSVSAGNLWAADLFQQALERRGIACAEPPRTLEGLPPSRRLALRGELVSPLFVHKSRPMSELVAIVNKPSQNFYAEMLLLAVAAESEGEGTAEAGERALVDLLLRAGADPEGLVAADGSGLSWRDLATARQIVTLLFWMAERPGAQAFYESLPIAGVDGTLEERMTQGPARGNVRAKTGYISKTRSMCGYAITRDGERLAFAILTNNYPSPTSRANALHDEIAQALAGFSRSGNR